MKYFVMARNGARLTGANFFGSEINVCFHFHYFGAPNTPRFDVCGALPLGYTGARAYAYA